jgi:xylan 1,4-beta-xylosidase
LSLAASGTQPGDSSPLIINAGDESYELSVDVELVDGAKGGILLYYDPRYYAGLGSDGSRLRFYKLSAEVPYGVPVIPSGNKMSFRLVNRENVVTLFYRTDGTVWKTYLSVEVAGYNHNVADGFLSPRPALYASGKGRAIFRNLDYHAPT